jgi:hypothetical protein
MEWWIIVGLVGGLVGGVFIAGVVLYIIFRAGEKRKKEIETAALHLGFEFEPQGESIAKSEFTELPLLKKGVGIRSPNLKQQCKNVLRGTRGSIELTTFDFQYSTGGQGAGRKITVAAFRSKDKTLPAFGFQPRGLLGMHIGGKDESIRFDEDLVFSKDYLLIGKDESAIRKQFTRDVRQVLSETDKKWAVEAQGKILLVYLQRQQAAPDKLAEFMETACGIAEAFMCGS